MNKIVIFIITFSSFAHIWPFPDPPALFLNSRYNTNRWGEKEKRGAWEIMITNEEKSVGLWCCPQATRRTVEPGTCAVAWCSCSPCPSPLTHCLTKGSPWLWATAQWLRWSNGERFIVWIAPPQKIFMVCARPGHHVGFQGPCWGWGWERCRCLWRSCCQRSFWCLWSLLPTGGHVDVCGLCCHVKPYWCS